MHRGPIGGLLSAFIVMGLSAGADAQVERSGNTYHKRVCALVVGPVARCHAHVVTDAAGHPLFDPAVHPTTPSGYGAADLRSAYNATATGSSATIVAIVDAYGYVQAERDLGVYRAQFGLPVCTTANGCFKKLNQIGQHGHYPVQDTNWAQESALDLDMASAMCPNCTIWLVEANSNGDSDLATAENTAARLGAHVISNSYGGDESDRTYADAYMHPGIAITASSGDNGYGVSFPASSPYVTAVGGTSLYRSGNSRGWSETVWSGAGSGCSAYFAKPSWQKDTGCPRRTVADVSAVADFITGVAGYAPLNKLRSVWMVFGGTSVAAPLIAGVYGANGGPVNFGSDPYNNVGALYDVTSGSNGSCRHSYLCTGEVGYDGPTGLGTPNGDGAF